MSSKFLFKSGWLLFLVLNFSIPVFAVDHNNIDAGRPLSFDDAESIAYREISFEAGVSGISPSKSRAGLGLSSELLYGFALNTQGGIDVDAATGGRAGSSKTNLDVENLHLNILHNFNREYGSVPAFSLRTDVSVPTKQNERGTEIRLRGILSKALIQYDRIHVNLDGIIASNPEEIERGFRPGMVVGYTKPIGYPRRFNQTALSEISIQTPAQQGTGPVVTVGLGLRQQVSVRSVIDVGVQSDIIAGGGAPHDNARVIVGYSLGF